MLNQAKKNLIKYYPVFGIQENYQVSVNLICLHYQLMQSVDIKIEVLQKRTHQKPIIDKSTRNSLIQQHSYDIELYNSALCRFIDLQKKYGMYK